MSMVPVALHVAGVGGGVLGAWARRGHGPDVGRPPLGQHPNLSLGQGDHHGGHEPSVGQRQAAPPNRDHYRGAGGGWCQRGEGHGACGRSGGHRRPSSEEGAGGWLESGALHRNHSLDIYTTCCTRCCAGTRAPGSLPSTHLHLTTRNDGRTSQRWARPNSRTAPPQAAPCACTGGCIYTCSLHAQPSTVGGGGGGARSTSDGSRARGKA